MPEAVIQRPKLGSVLDIPSSMPYRGAVPGHGGSENRRHVAIIGGLDADDTEARKGWCCPQ